MAKYKKGDRILITGGKYKEYETATFERYSGMLSAVVGIKVEGVVKEKTLRLSSIDEMPATPMPGETIRVEKSKYLSLLQQVTMLGEAVEELKHRLEELELN